jgi:formylglycine-generating enzyme required for sulfatase activity
MRAVKFFAVTLALALASISSTWSEDRTDACAFKPKEPFKECSNCPEMIVAPSGSFLMGSPENEPKRSSNEGPPHKVTFAQPFAVGKFSVTFDEWDACTASGGCNGYTPSDHGWGRGRRPVLYVSWDDAQAYVTWLAHATGKTYRLLSEAEREYVTRAGTATPYWFGTSISPEQANYDNYNSTNAGGSHLRTSPVDAFEPNPWGLYQVHGNVSEWTEDCYHESYQNSPSDGSAWKDGDCSRHVIRGGSLVDDSRDLRSASRGADPTDFRSLDKSFRVARAVCER